MNLLARESKCFICEIQKGKSFRPVDPLSGLFALLGMAFHLRYTTLTALRLPPQYYNYNEHDLTCFAIT